MPRTPEQVAADDALAEAIQRCRDAYIPAEEQGVLTEWMVLYASRHFSDDSDDDGTAVGRLVCTPAPPLHHQLGMLNYVAAEYRHRITHDVDD
jgi:hypothetical protein